MPELVCKTKKHLFPIRHPNIGLTARSLNSLLCRIHERRCIKHNWFRVSLSMRCTRYTQPATENVVIYVLYFRTLVFGFIINNANVNNTYWSTCYMHHNARTMRTYINNKFVSFFSSYARLVAGASIKFLTIQNAHGISDQKFGDANNGRRSSDGEDTINIGRPYEISHKIQPFKHHTTQMTSTKDAVETDTASIAIPDVSSNEQILYFANTNVNNNVKSKYKTKLH